MENDTAQLMNRVKICYKPRSFPPRLPPAPSHFPQSSYLHHSSQYSYTRPLYPKSTSAKPKLSTLLSTLTCDGSQPIIPA